MDREDTRTDAEATNGTTQVNTNMENSGGDWNVDFGDEDCESQDDTSVSYTHLTLPTIYSV